MTEPLLKALAPSTVNRGRTVKLNEELSFERWSDEYVTLQYGNSLNFYAEWERPTVIVSDGAYGILGFEGDTSDHIGMPEWYEPHVRAW